MTARGRGYSSSIDWDATADDYNNSVYDPQDEESSGMIQLDHSRLYITNLPRGLNEEGLKAAFSRFGALEESYMSRDPLKRFALVKFETSAEARVAMMKMNKTEPLHLNISIAHKTRSKIQERSYSNTNRERERNRDDNISVSSKGKRSNRPQKDQSNGDEMEEKIDDDISTEIDHSLHFELETIKLEQLKIKEEQLECRHRLLLLQQNEKKLVQNQGSGGSKRCILPDGRIVVRNTEKFQDGDTSFAAGAGDSNENTCSCKKSDWHEESGSSTPSTCVLCSEDRSAPKRSITKTDISKSTSEFRHTESKSVTVSKSKHSDYSKITDSVSRRSDVTSKKCDSKKCPCKVRSDMTGDLKFCDFYADSDDESDETNRLIQLRNSDYLDIVEDQLKLVIVLAGYPKSKMRLRQMELFQRCLNDIIDMQVKEGLMKKGPSFLDYYLNRGAIVCICKDLDTRDWMVRVSPGLQERMCTNLVLLNAKVKRLCLAVLKIPSACWPATAQDAFKLLQYFNPSLKTNLWKVYSQKVAAGVECTSFLIDRVSGEIIRGPSFKNVIDYEQMEFELTGYSEIYYECLLSGIQEDLSSVASRVKLLEEIKSASGTPRTASTVSVQPTKEASEENNKECTVEIEELSPDTTKNKAAEAEMKKALESALQENVLKKIKDVEYIGENEEVLVWSDETAGNDKEEETDIIDSERQVENMENETTSTSYVVSESAVESNDNLLSKSSTINIDSNRGIAYHRRTNYLHVENELKVAITLEGYPQNKLEGIHIRRLKHLFKEYLHKDMKSQRFANLIIPKFQDIYLSNGAVIYICDSLETKDYLTEVLPKFINSTGLKLTFRDIKNLVRYTRIVIRLPKEQAHVESIEILMKLQEKYPGLKPDCWKYYSDVAGKQKRQFGVDPESLEVIKSPDFDPEFNGEKITCRIIDRQKRDNSSGITKTEDEDTETSKQRDKILKKMYTPIDPEIANAPLTRIRTNHYSDLIADDLKLYVGPKNYPDSRIDETLFHNIKRTFEKIIIESYENDVMKCTDVPKFHDMYLFDGVIFIICQNMESRVWVENNVANVNEKLKINLKSTEFRGAVGIISMYARIDKDTNEVISILQSMNPRLRTKFWRKISTVRTSTKLDAVLQIDKLSAQVIMDAEFQNLIDNEPVQFKLGHLQSLIKPKASLEELIKAHTLKMEKKINKAMKSAKKKTKKAEVKDVNDNIEIETEQMPKSQDDKISDTDLDPIIIEPESPKLNKDLSLPESYQAKIILKIPTSILPDNQDDLNIIFDILEDKNPGLNTEIWQVFSESAYPNNGKFILYVDKQSLSIIQNKNFDSSVGGEKLKFYF